MTEDEVDYTCDEVRAAQIWLLRDCGISLNMLEKQIKNTTDEFIQHQTETSADYRREVQQLVEKYRKTLPTMH